MRRRTSRNRRRAFLLEEKRRSPAASKRLRNRFLNAIAKLLLLKHITKLFRASFLLGIAVIGMTAFIAFAVFSPYFEIKKISVVRDSPHLDIESIEQALQDFYGENMIFLDKTRLKSTLKEAFPEFRSIKVEEQWPAEISIKIGVSPPTFSLLNTETANFSVLSADGVVLQAEPNEELPLIKVFQYTKPIKVRDKLLEPLQVQHIQEAEKLLTNLDLAPAERHLYWAALEMHFITPQKTAFWIDITQDIPPQIQKLEWSADDIGLYSKVLEHVDLRIPKQIFWKDRPGY